MKLTSRSFASCDDLFVELDLNHSGHSLAVIVGFLVCSFGRSFVPNRPTRFGYSLLVVVEVFFRASRSASRILFARR